MESGRAAGEHQRPGPVRRLAFQLGLTGRLPIDDAAVTLGNDVYALQKASLDVTAGVTVDFR